MSVKEILVWFVIKKIKVFKYSCTVAFYGCGILCIVYYIVVCACACVWWDKRKSLRFGLLQDIFFYEYKNIK